MRKSTTSARMMKKRSRGIPKPLFQSVQFPALITTSNTLYQVVYTALFTHKLSSFFFFPLLLCGHKITLSFCLCHVCHRYSTHLVSFCIHLLFSVSLGFSFSLWSSSCVSALWPTHSTLNPHRNVITAKHHFIRVACVRERERFMGKWSAQVKRMHGNVSQQKLFVSRIF